MKGNEKEKERNKSDERGRKEMNIEGKMKKNAKK
jgi:hypothetical protein